MFNLVRFDFLYIGFMNNMHYEKGSGVYISKRLNLACIKNGFI